MGVQIKLRSLENENTCHTWALLLWWFTTKRRYIKCIHLYLSQADCGKAHVQSQWERANDITIPEIFQILTWHPWLCPRDLHQCKFSFQSVQLGFSPNRWNITVLWLFYLVILYFFSGTRPDRTVNRFSPFMAHTTCFHPRTVLLGVVTISVFIWGNIPQNSPKRCVKRLNRRNIKITISCKV